MQNATTRRCNEVSFWENPKRYTKKDPLIWQRLPRQVIQLNLPILCIWQTEVLIKELFSAPSKRKPWKIVFFEQRCKLQQITNVVWLQVHDVMTRSMCNNLKVQLLVYYLVLCFESVCELSGLQLQPHNYLTSCWLWKLRHLSCHLLTVLGKQFHHISPPNHQSRRGQHFLQKSKKLNHCLDSTYGDNLHSLFLNMFKQDDDGLLIILT